jgi:hypothetical protein
MPGSQSSPFSTMPLPHICKVIVKRLGSGVTKQVVLVFPPGTPCINEPSTRISELFVRVKIMKDLQMLPRLQGEKFISPATATGLIKNLASASQVCEFNGQHGDVELQLSEHWTTG